MASASSMHEAGHSKPVLWDNPGVRGVEGGGRGVQDGGIHLCIHDNVWQKSPQCYNYPPIKIN